MGGMRPPSTLRKRLFFSFAIIISLLAVLFAVFFTTVQGTYRVLSTIQEDQFGIDALARSVDALYEAADNYLHSGRQEYLTAYDSAYQRSRSQVAALRARLPSAFYFEVVDIGNMILSFNELTQDTVALYGKGLETIYVNRYVAELSRLRGYIRSECSRVLSSYMERVNDQFVSLRAALERSANLCYLVLLVIMIACVAIAATLTREVSRPIHELARSLQRFAAGELDLPPLERRKNDEIAVLVRSFNEMTVEIRQLVEGMRRASVVEGELRRQEIRTLEAENALKQSELESLQARINPHFLFNALNTVSALAEIEEAGRTKGAVESLAQLLRTNLKAARSVVPLGEELESVGHYLRFQKMRFGSRLSYTIRNGEATGSIPVPGMILQPFVENAVIHGLEPLERGGSIVVEAHRANDELAIDVTDDGAGFDPALLAPPAGGGQGESGSPRHLGIMNVSRRLELLYGRQVIFIESRTGMGTRVRIRLPVGGEPLRT